MSMDAKDMKTVWTMVKYTHSAALLAGPPYLSSQTVGIERHAPEKGEGDFN